MVETLTKKATETSMDMDHIHRTIGLFACRLLNGIYSIDVHPFRFDNEGEEIIGGQLLKAYKFPSYKSDPYFVEGVNLMRGFTLRYLIRLVYDSSYELPEEVKVGWQARIKVGSKERINDLFLTDTRGLKVIEHVVGQLCEFINSRPTHPNFSLPDKAELLAGVSAAGQIYHDAVVGYSLFYLDDLAKLQKATNTLSAMKH